MQKKFFLVFHLLNYFVNNGLTGMSHKEKIQPLEKKEAWEKKQKERKEKKATEIGGASTAEKAQR